MRLVFAHRRVHRIPRPTFVTIAKRPSCGYETAMALLLFLPIREAKYFCERVWTVIRQTARRANQTWPDVVIAKSEVTKHCNPRCRPTSDKFMDSSYVWFEGGSGHALPARSGRILTQGGLYETSARAGLHSTSIAGNKAISSRLIIIKKRKTFENRKARLA